MRTTGNANVGDTRWTWSRSLAARRANDSPHGAGLRNTAPWRTILVATMNYATPSMRAWLICVVERDRHSRSENEQREAEFTRGLIRGRKVATLHCDDLGIIQTARDSQRIVNGTDRRISIATFRAADEIRSRFISELMMERTDVRGCFETVFMKYFPVGPRWADKRIRRQCFYACITQHLSLIHISEPTRPY